jgi:hypothetical protein
MMVCHVELLNISAAYCCVVGEELVPHASVHGVLPVGAASRHAGRLPEQATDWVELVGCGLAAALGALVRLEYSALSQEPKSVAEYFAGEV